MLPSAAADMVALVVAHARAGACYRFATTQLLNIAADCMVSSIVIQPFCALVVTGYNNMVLQV